MNLFELNLVAGEPRTVGIVGKYFRILGGAGDFKIEARYKSGGSLSSLMISGLGVDFSKPENSEPYIELSITSKVTQTVRFLSSMFESSDSRLTGDVDINGLLSVVNNGGSSRAAGTVSVTAATATQLRPANTNRLKCAFHFPADVFIGKDNTVNNINGFPLSSGSKWVDENTAEIWVYCTSAITVPYIEDLK